ncbi:hypothetical protein A2997_00980 [Candidatus Nomurabacteria bacterium RIFCSPLOWO2_01_FULL_36_10b]|uniref:Thioredoxin-like fold domain-containing protein n=1 Tax=Candidatus Nomurabacteria bacterium RIFCSPLOWO2_01_FULL_36_10b TaxID=1801766 RepID=A0A1F6WPU4_9BACT|nr:MAG: hypothetical protein A2997_00980 [Candidatus Nomurabacteria bacterium RIFCSPLOWO2_01_FULL_36_10b]
MESQNNGKTGINTPTAIIIGAVIIALGLAFGLKGNQNQKALNMAPDKKTDQVQDFSNQREKIINNLSAKAEQITGIPQNEFIACMQNPIHAEKVKNDSRFVSDEGTPYNIIKSEKYTLNIVGALPYKMISGIVNDMLNNPDFVVPDDFKNTLPNEELIIRSTDHVRGSLTAPITIFEYSDISCPFCKEFHPTLKKLIEEYPNDVAWVYRHHPLLDKHPIADLQAIATECAGALRGSDAFWELLDDLISG